MPAYPPILQLASQGTVAVTAPDTAMDAPLTAAPELADVSSTVRAVGSGHGCAGQSTLQAATGNANATATMTFGMIGLALTYNKTMLPSASGTVKHRVIRAQCCLTRGA